MGVKDLLGKILLAHPDQYTPEHLLKPVNYQKVGKNGLSPPSTYNLVLDKFVGYYYVFCTLTFCSDNFIVDLLTLWGKVTGKCCTATNIRSGETYWQIWNVSR